MGVAAQTVCGSARSYRPREVERSLVYRIVARELEDFVADAVARGHPLPRFVETTMRDYLACGLFEYGFVTLRCSDCAASRTVAFSCKRRGVCSSCQGRRMSETAAHLTQWVLPVDPRVRPQPGPADRKPCFGPARPARKVIPKTSGVLRLCPSLREKHYRKRRILGGACLNSLSSPRTA